MSDVSGNPAPDNQQEPTQAQEVDPNSIFADQLNAIKAPDGRQKYNDVATALDSIPHAQSHIDELSGKVKELEEELTKRKGAEELLEALQSNQQVVETPSDTGLDATNIQEVVNQILDNKAQETTAAANASKVKAALQDKFGTKASSEFEKKATELGMSVAGLTQLAQTSPAAALQLFGTEPVADHQPNVVSDVVVSPNPVKQEDDIMARFTGKDSGSLIDKWRKAGEVVTQS